MPTSTSSAPTFSLRVAEYLAVVGPHEDYHTPPVIEFLTALAQTHPDTVVVSGGAAGIDTCGEQTWLGLGGRVISYRPKKVGEEDYGVEVWELGFDHPRVYEHLESPTGRTWVDAAFIRNILIADRCTRLTAWYSGRRTPGASFTEAWARDTGKPTFAMGLAA